MEKFETGKLSIKGQVVIPASVREMLEIGEGDRLEFIQEGDKIMVKGIKKRSILDAVGLIKTNKPFVDVDEIRDQTRKEIISRDLNRSNKEV